MQVELDIPADTITPVFGAARRRGCEVLAVRFAREDQTTVVVRGAQARLVAGDTPDAELRRVSDEH